jgi:hypothetical protein
MCRWQIIGRDDEGKYADIVLNLAAHPSGIYQEHARAVGGYEKISPMGVAVTQRG